MKIDGFLFSEEAILVSASEGKKHIREADDVFCKATPQGLTTKQSEGVNPVPATTNQILLFLVCFRIKFSKLALFLPILRN